jgi:hypothetical protein
MTEPPGLSIRSMIAFTFSFSDAFFKSFTREPDAISCSPPLKGLLPPEVPDRIGPTADTIAIAFDSSAIC